MKKNLFKQNNILNIFCAVTLFGTFAAMLGMIIYYVIAFAALSNGSHDFDWLLGIFSDFVVIMNTAIEESPYLVEGASYPPLAIMILYPFALICKNVFALYANQTLTVDELTSKLTVTPEFWIAIILFFLICTSLVIFLIAKKYDLHGTELFKAAVIVTASAPFTFAVMRGNTIYFALIFLLIFLTLKDSKNAALRELSYLSLALAGCIKIYPLFFGVFLLKDKKIFASLRVAVYFFAIFFASFCLFERGLVDFSAFYDNLEGFATNDVRLLGFNNLSISALIYKIMYCFNPALSADSTAFSVINLSVIAVVFAVSSFAAIYTKNDFTRLVIAAAIVILVPSISYFYVLIFAVLPFLEYAKIADTMSRKRASLYFAAFMFLFVTFFILPKIFVIHSLIIMAMLAAEVAGVLKKEIFKKSDILQKADA